MAMATIQMNGREGCGLCETSTTIQQCRLGCRSRMGAPPVAANGGEEALPPSVAEVFRRPYRCSPSAVRLTVWCKSLLFNGRGYTVYDDSDGRMVFRVDNYAQNWREEAHLMDSAGNVLLTVRRSRKEEEFQRRISPGELPPPPNQDPLFFTSGAGAAKKKQVFTDSSVRTTRSGGF